MGGSPGGAEAESAAEEDEEEDEEEDAEAWLAPLKDADEIDERRLPGGAISSSTSASSSSSSSSRCFRFRLRPRMRLPSSVAMSVRFNKSCNSPIEVRNSMFSWRSATSSPAIHDDKEEEESAPAARREALLGADEEEVGEEEEEEEEEKAVGAWGEYSGAGGWIMEVDGVAAKEW